MKRVIIDDPAPVPVMFCPCCGRPVEERDPAKLIELIPMGYTERATLNALLARFGQLVTRREIVSRVYGHRPDGGPAHAYEVVNGYLRKLGPRLATAGLVIELNHRLGVRLRWANAIGKAA